MKLLNKKEHCSGQSHTAEKDFIKNLEINVYTTWRVEEGAREEYGGIFSTRIAGKPVHRKVTAQIQKLRTPENFMLPDQLVVRDYPTPPIN